MIVRNDNIQEAQIDQLPDYQLLYDDAFGLTKVNLKAWFKGDAGVTLSGSDVVSWTSQWGSPAIVANVVEGETDWEVGGTLNTYLSVRQPNAAFKSLNFNSALSISSSYTIFAVMRSPETTAEYVLKSGETGMTGFNLGPGYGGPGPFLFDGSTSAIGTGGFTNDSPQYVMWQSGPQGTNLRQNGVQTLTNGAGKYVSPTGILGRNGIEIWEILIYADVKSNTEVVNIENYIKTKYGF